MSEFKHLSFPLDSSCYSSWRQVSLEDVATITMGQSPDSKTYNLNQEGLPLLQGNADIANGVTSPKQYTSAPTKYCNTNDIVVTVRAPVGEVAIAKEKCCIGRGVCSLRANSEAITSFIYYLLVAKKSLWNNLEQGSTFSAINSSDIKSFKISIPSLIEQQKIAEFLTALDEKIRLENQKLIRFHELKKKLLVNVFSFEDYCETGFFDVVQSLMDYRGKTPLKLGMSWSDVETPYLALSALNVKDQGIDHSKEAHYGTKVLYNKWMKDKPLRPKQILMTTEAPAGVVMQVPDDRPYILSQRVIALDVDPAQVDECFFAYLLRSPFVQKQFERLCSGGTAKGISQKHLRELKVRYPKSIKTQQRIADLFCNIDSRISICAKKLESLEKLKKAFMQRMFV